MRLCVFRPVAGFNLFIVLLFAAENLLAQCPNGSTFQTTSHNFYLIGNGNNTYRLPMFDPSEGTLYKVDLKTKVYAAFGYTLTNTASYPVNYDIIVSREDTLTAASPFNPAPIELLAEFNSKKLSHKGAGAIQEGVFSFNQALFPTGKTINTTIEQDVVPFMGSDSLYLTYTTGTSALSGPPNTSDDPYITITNKTSTDSLILSIIYYYCPTAILPSRFIRLSATRQSEAGVQLLWTSADSFTEGWFEVLKSTDGKAYTSVNKQPIDKNNPGSYHYLYKPGPKDGTKGFFRIRQTAKNGQTIYSGVLTAALPKSVGDAAENTNTNRLLVYPASPAPSGSVTVVLPAGNRSDEWQLSLISMTGQILQQSSVKDVTRVQLELKSGLSAGLYLINAYNKVTRTSYKGKIIIQR